MLSCHPQASVSRSPILNIEKQGTEHKRTQIYLCVSDLNREKTVGVVTGIRNTCVFSFNCMSVF